MLQHIAKLPPVRTLMMCAAHRQAGQFQSKHPLAYQRNIFRELISNAAETRFGRDHYFSSLLKLPFEEAYAWYRQLVPIRTYQDFWNDYFQDCRRNTEDGKNYLEMKDVTWPGMIEMFCETSGTTAPTKYIPFSSQMFEENQRAALDMICCYLKEHPGSGILNGKILYMSGSTELTQAPAGIFSGDMSAITLRFRPWYTEPFVEPPLSISAMPWEDKLQAMAELLLRDREIRVISGVPPWIILLLKRCCEISGKPASQALSHLELIIHGGTSIKPYQNEFRELFGNALPGFIELLPSSEAFMGFQCAGESHMRLTPFYGTFFEFVRLEDLDEHGRPDNSAPAVPLAEVKTGQRYAIILSTCSGLWRYHIGDTIRFTGLDPYHIEFTGRDRFLDKLEEKVTQEEVEKAVASLNSSGLFTVQEFVVGADVPQRRHVWVLAGTANSGKDSVEMAAVLDMQLRQLNADYDTFRRQGRINPPDVMTVPDNTIYAWSKAVRGKLGGQSKIPHIDPTMDSTMISSIIAYAASTSPTAELNV